VTGNVVILPVWKKGASVEEWFYDLAMLARTHPERFQRVVLIYEEKLPDDGSTRCDYYSHGLTTTEMMGLIEIGKFRVWNEATGN
jgi:hypothetical protein